MDSNNRRIVMELLYTLAKEQPDKQFIFFTPQGTKGLKRAGVDVFTLEKLPEAA